MKEKNMRAHTTNRDLTKATSLAFCSRRRLRRFWATVLACLFLERRADGRPFRCLNLGERGKALAGDNDPAAGNVDGSADADGVGSSSMTTVGISGDRLGPRPFQPPPAGGGTPAVCLPDFLSALKGLNVQDAFTLFLPKPFCETVSPHTSRSPTFSLAATLLPGSDEAKDESSRGHSDTSTSSRQSSDASGTSQVEVGDCSERQPFTAAWEGEVGVCFPPAHLLRLDVHLATIPLPSCGLVIVSPVLARAGYLHRTGR